MSKCLALGLSLIAGATASGSEPLILDMVHHNPGEAPYDSAYVNPEVIKEMGYNGKVYFLFESPMLAINWESVDSDILPKGSEERDWVDAKAAQIQQMQADCEAAGLTVFAQSDLMLFPKRLIEKYGIEKTFGDPNNPQTEKLLRAQLNEMFDQFPKLDGLVVRIGETYLHDAPYHQGHIKNKGSAQRTIIPLMKILREEICEKRDKQLIFRTWLAFDRDVKTYQAVSNAVEPHPNLVISIKHCEGDFHRTNPFSKVIGQGRHRQIIEVQAAREYEGKGAYPNYIANGVIEGFEEHAGMPEARISSLREFTEKKPELFAGIWTWTRGGGWDGPYIQNEMWCDLNAWVVAQWAADPSQSEAAVFNRYATERLNLKGEDVVKFRKLCLLSADAVIRGRNTTEGDISPWWTRDQGIGWPAANKDPKRQARNSQQKDESITMWKEIVSLAESIQWADEPTREHAIASANYGLRLYEIYRCVVRLSDAEAKKNKGSMRDWIKAYDAAWAAYNKLPEQYPSIATLYTQDYKRHIKSHAHTKVNQLRKQTETAAKPVTAKPAFPAWFSQEKAGMFIHWGLYSEVGCEWQGETGDRDAHLQHEFKIPLVEYAKLADVFNPVKYDADAYAKLAKDAGFGYIVYVAKHHDGFAMFDSPSDSYNIVDATPYKRDPLKELSEACKKYDLTLCVYYSLGRDWSVPGVPPRGWRANTWDFPNASDKDVARYLEKKAKPQLREILTQYGPIGSIWFDTPDSINKRQSADLYKLIKSLQPDCLVNNRVGNKFGDYDTPEQKIPKTGLTRPWETCMTINDHWAYVRTNDNWKSTSLLVRCLVDIASKGGNLLLNVGPTGTGEIPAPSVDRLHAIGDWMKLHGESIYGTSASSYGTGEDTGIVFSDIQGDGTQKDPSQKIGRHQVPLPHGMRVTEKPGVLYIHLFDHLEDNKLKLNDLPSTVTKATLLSDPNGGALKFIQNGKEFSCQLPQGIWNEHCTVVKLEVTAAK